MGARRGLGIAVLWAALLAPAARVAAVTVAEPIARLSLEGGYDTNALYLGQGGDRTGRISPDVGFRLLDHLFKLTATYGGDWLVYERLASHGIWNHRGALDLDAAPTQRTRVTASARGGYAFDPVGLAQMGIFRTGQRSAWTVQGRGRAEWDASRRLELAVTATERTVVFSDRSGGAMHAPGAEALWHASERLAVGAAYAAGVFQGFDPTGDSLAWSQGLRARARYRITRMLEVDGYAGPAMWIGNRDQALVPEAGAELRLARREMDLRVAVAHGLGIGSTARPGLVDSAEVGVVRRFGLRFDVRGDGGIWHSGEVPSGRNSTLGYAAAGEAGMMVGGGVRVALGVTHFARIDDPSADLRRTTVGIRLGWTLPAR
ncbi:hypothetical protein AnaeK_2737 [Anaeromyxobacter sp. K]|uniref:Autotransporter domain-containing protein n=1 Tax=Anaeromyxobacter dehalogenans (strain ATCC BAA-258 / DSM 21875 / 2CP-1) TaxID=455488 RepID=B8JEM3_ANAD2|nr:MULTISPECIES: hypothetical protein [Anaeromyxobacter]ACG73962.1 hypothetical protein AnaeK_2737 [Anaeromyxobacter sp. K]ACL66169.1 conserved hypothetical protein [Anaeromyxobacter dehalogenans 2CP-1]